MLMHIIAIVGIVATLALAGFGVAYYAYQGQGGE